MLSLRGNMLIWRAITVCIFCSFVKGSPTVKLLESTSTTFCHNFQLAGHDHTVLKYYIAGANSVFQLGAVTAPTLIDLQTQKTLCFLLHVDSGNCTHTQVKGHDCWCDQIGDGQYHLTYKRTADSEMSNTTVVLRWPGKYGDELLTKLYTFKEVTTGM
ncbi:hypothetical protein ElyMa_000245300 [Elysia marginata]|uniref:Secreted protein n=1 Tax=Elysia marginata TaxID=1093978 RepID=A0AAV4F2U1_9GAST|nr:hypothetical protein ElyMa_000245300 [Elysia marginata]